MKRITTEQEFHEAIAQDKLTVAVFKTIWCKDCHYIEPFMPELESKYAEQADFVHIDRDELPGLCEQLNILGIPSFVAFRRGQELTRFVSKLRKTREEIEHYLSRTVEVAEALAK